MKEPNNYIETLKEIMQNHMCLNEEGCQEVYADYRDEISLEMLKDAFIHPTGETLVQTLEDYLYENTYQEWLDQFVSELKENLERNCNDNDIKAYFNYYSDDIFDDLDRAGFNGIDVSNYISDVLYNTHVNVNLMFGTDTEINHMFNTTSDLMCQIQQLAKTKQHIKVSDIDAELSDSMLVELINQQGHSLQDFLDALDTMDKKGMSNSQFYNYLVDELDELGNRPGAFTIMLQTRGDKLAQLYDNIFNKDATITIERDVNTGFVDPYSGACGALEIYLEKPLTLPLNKLRYIQLEGSRNHEYSIGFDQKNKDIYDNSRHMYTVDDICGLIGSFWRDNFQLNI